MKIGNTDFNVKACKKLTLTKFKKIHGATFKGMDIEKAWKILKDADKDSK